MTWIKVIQNAMTWMKYSTQIQFHANCGTKNEHPGCIQWVEWIPYNPSLTICKFTRSNGWMTRNGWFSIKLGLEKEVFLIGPQLGWWWMVALYMVHDCVLHVDCDNQFRGRIIAIMTKMAWADVRSWHQIGEYTTHCQQIYDVIRWHNGTSQDSP